MQNPQKEWAVPRFRLESSNQIRFSSVIMSSLSYFYSQESRIM